MAEINGNHDLYIVLGKNWKKFTPSKNPELSFESKVSALAGGRKHMTNPDSHVLFVTGKTAGSDKQGNPFPSESEAMASLAQKFYSINKGYHHILHGSYTTRTDAISAHEFVKSQGFDKPALITVFPHTIRAKNIFNQFGFDLSDRDIFDSFAVMSNAMGSTIEEYKQSTIYKYNVIKELVCLLLTKTVDPNNIYLDTVAVHTRHRQKS